MATHSDVYPDFKLRRSIALFVDFLGVKEVAASAEAQNFVTLVRDAINESRQRQIVMDGTKAVRYFSDSLLAGYPVTPMFQESTARWFATEDAAHWQLSMIVNLGLFARGGISAGDLVIREDVSFGEALVRAAELESKTALFPRIVIDPRTVAEAEQPIEWVRQDEEDEVHFVSYLELALDNSYRDEAAHVFGEHHRRIADSLSEHQDNSVVRNKYLWSAHYHDTIAEKYMSDGGTEVPTFDLDERPDYSRITYLK